MAKSSPIEALRALYHPFIARAQGLPDSVMRPDLREQLVEALRDASQIEDHSDKADIQLLTDHLTALIQPVSRPDIFLTALLAATPILTVMAAEAQGTPDKYAGQVILAIDRHALEQILGGLPTGFIKLPNAAVALSCIMNSMHTTWQARGPLETMPTFKQIIPYIAVVHKGSLLTYSRGKRGAEDRLHAKRSWGFGGHIDCPVAKENAHLAHPGTGTFTDALKRELQEEIGAEVDEWRVLGFVNNEADAVGQVHIGVVCLVELDDISMLDFSADDGIVDPLWLPVGDLLKPEVLDHLEGWSQLAAEALTSYLSPKLEPSPGGPPGRVVGMSPALGAPYGKAADDGPNYEDPSIKLDPPVAGDTLDSNAY